MIVKNEAHVLRETLSTIAPYINYWIISDTGSTDTTPKVIRDFFQEKGIPGELFHDKWKDFGHNRTVAFRHAYKKSEYVWVIDADDLVTGSLVLPSLLTADAYLVRYKQWNRNDYCLYERPQIFNNRLRWEYRGVLHEFAVCVDKMSITEESIGGDYAIESRRLGDRNRNPLKYLRDAQTLEHALASTAQNDFLYWRYVYYIGQSYYDFGELSEAVPWFQKRTKGPLNEEVYFAYLYTGQCFERRDQPRDAIENYLRGYSLMPLRAECPYFLALLYWNRGEYEKCFRTLHLCKDLSPPTKSLITLVSIYQMDALLLYARACHMLNKHTEEEQSWKRLLTNPSIQNTLHQKVDIRLFPLAVSLLSPSPPFFPEDYSLIDIGKKWLWLPAIKEITPDNKYTTYVAGPHDEYPRLIQKSGRATDEEIGYSESILCVCMNPEHEMGTTYPQFLPHVTVTYCIGEGLTPQDFQTAFLVFCLCSRHGFGYRVSKKPYPYSTPVLSDLTTEKQVVDWLRKMPTIVKSDTFRIEWLGNINERHQSYDHFCQVLSIQTIDQLEIYSGFSPTSFLDVIGAKTYILEDKQHETWPLVSLLYSWFPVSVRWKDEKIRFFGNLSKTVLEPDEIIAWCAYTLSPIPVVVQKENLDEMNKILEYPPCFVFLTDETQVLSHDCAYHLVLKKNFILLESLFRWLRFFIECIKNLEQLENKWEKIYLDDDGTFSEPQFLEIKNRNSAFYLVNHHGRWNTNYHFPLFRSCPSEALETRYVRFPHLLFIDSEVFFHPSLDTPHLLGFDGYNDAGFFKTWREDQSIEYMNDFAGDYVSMKWIDTNGFLDELGPKTWKHVTCDIPYIPKKDMPVYCINLKRRVDRRQKMKDIFQKGRLTVRFVDAVDGRELRPEVENMNLFLGNQQGYSLGMMGCALSHLFLWEALSDSVHEYFIIFEDDVEFSTQAPFSHDLEASLYTILSQLQNIPLWDIVFLGYSRWEDKDRRDGTQTLCLEPLEKSYIGGSFGYVIHKKAALFLVNMIRYSGFTAPLDHVWKHPFLRLYQLSCDLVRTPWCRPDNTNTHFDSDIQFETHKLLFFSPDDFLVLTDTTLRHKHIQKKWSSDEHYMSVVSVCPQFSAFDRHGRLFSTGWTEDDLVFSKDETITVYRYRQKYLDV